MCTRSNIDDLKIRFSRKSLSKTSRTSRQYRTRKRSTIGLIYIAMQGHILQALRPSRIHSGFTLPTEFGPRLLNWATALSLFTAPIAKALHRQVQKCNAMTYHPHSLHLWLQWYLHELLQGLCLSWWRSYYHRGNGIGVTSCTGVVKVV